MKKTVKRLQFRTERIRDLTISEQARAHGGVSGGGTANCTRDCSVLTCGNSCDPQPVPIEAPCVPQSQVCAPA